MDKLTSVIAAGIGQTLEKVNTKFISMIAENYGIDENELNELYGIACKEETKGMKRSKRSRKGPKKLSGFQLFSNEQRKAIKDKREKEEEEPLTFGDTSKEIAKRWRNVPDEEKDEYKLRAIEENEKRKQTSEKEKKNEEKSKKKMKKKMKKKTKAKKSPKVIEEEEDELIVELDEESIDEEKDSTGEEEYSSESGDDSSSTSSSTPATCIAIITRGKREGFPCGKKVQKDAEYCRSHNK
jgi:hypothetical protein